jgi:hypothetical protein
LTRLQQGGCFGLALPPDASSCVEVGIIPLKSIIGFAEVLQAHGGDIRVSSELGQGSTFSFRIPSRRENVWLKA